MSCPDDAQLLAYATQRASPEDRRDLESHLDECSGCRELLSLLGKTASLVATPNAAASSLTSPIQLRSVVLSPGTQVSRYFVMRLIGAGAMGTVYEAYDPELKREVALKMVRPTPDLGDVLGEARSMAKLAHPNVVVVYDAGWHGEELFIAMERIQGTTLREWLRAPRAREEILAMFEQAAEGLAAVHASGLVHRDVKPDNILVGSDGRARLTDFGLAQQARVETMGEPQAVAGTPAYMAPESRTGLQATASSDQYAYCVALHEGIFGVVPRDGFDPSSLGGLSSQTRIPKALRQLLERGLSARPEDRFSSMSELLAAFPKRTRSTRRWSIALGLALVLVGVGEFAASRYIKEQQLICSGAERKLVGAWDTDRRLLVQRALKESNRPFSGVAFEKAATLLDAYAQRWVEAHTEACEATQLRREQSEEALDLRMQCLHSGLQRLKAVTQVLSESRPELPERTVDLAVGLPSVELCSDLEWLRHRVVPRLSEAEREKSRALEDRLARGSVLIEAGRLTDARSALEALVPEAQAAGFKWILGAGLAQLGRIENTGGDPKKGLATFEQAIVALEAAGDDRTLVMAWTELALNAQRRGRADGTAASRPPRIRAGGGELRESTFRRRKATGLFSGRHLSASRSRGAARRRRQSGVARELPASTW
jgi:predicted Ser/Thr protein kinase